MSSILCVCTGNTCRSPMLSALLKAAVQKHDLHNIEIVSAGTSAAAGAPASGQAVQVMASRGLDISHHRSQSVTGLDVTSFDHVLCMSSSHAAFVRSLGVSPQKLHVVNAEHGGVPDPFGGSVAEYAACADVLSEFADVFSSHLVNNETVPSESQLVAARTQIDAIHASEPAPPSGKPTELAYADHIERWITRLVPDASIALQLAARCQHLERWAIPRSSFPMDKPGYFAWRKAVHRHQGDQARAALVSAGIPTTITERVALLVAKATSKDDKEGQALEDAACLTFIETELGDFAAQHPDYSREKLIDIIRKTWRKMSPAAHQLALSIPLDDALKELVITAIEG